MIHSLIPKCDVDFVYQAPLSHGFFNPRVMLADVRFELSREAMKLMLIYVLFVSNMHLWFTFICCLPRFNYKSKGRKRIPLLWSCVASTCNSKSFGYKKDEGWGRIVTTWMWSIYYTGLKFWFDCSNIQTTWLTKFAKEYYNPSHLLLIIVYESLGDWTTC